MSLMFGYYQELSKKSNKTIFNIDHIDYIENDTFKAWFAYDKAQFEKFCTFTRTYQPKHVAVFLRTALSNNQLAFLFNVSERTIANYMSNARKNLLENFVPQFINNNDRSVLVNHTTPMVKELFDIPDDKACCIFDATYRLTLKKLRRTKTIME